jgi:hypothetical protein
MNSEEESTFLLTFKVPEIDFDAGDLDVALLWLKKKLETCAHPQDEYGGIMAYNLLKKVHDRYMDALGEPSWKAPALPY